MQLIGFISRGRLVLKIAPFPRVIVIFDKTPCEFHDFKLCVGWNTGILDRDEDIGCDFLQMTGREWKNMISYCKCSLAFKSSELCRLFEQIINLKERQGCTLE